MKVSCLNCGYEFELIAASADELGWHTICPECDCSFDIDLPHHCELFQRLCDYCRGTDVYVVDGKFEVRFKCDPCAENTTDTTATCNKCPKAGCHIHAAANQAELILNGEIKEASSPT